MPFKSLCLGVSVAKIATQWQIAEFGVRSAEFQEIGHRGAEAQRGNRVKCLSKLGVSESLWQEFSGREWFEVDRGWRRF